MDTKQHPIDVIDPKVQQACEAIFAAVLRRDSDELQQVLRFVAAAAAACWWASDYRVER